MIVLYIILGIIVAFLLLQYSMVLRMKLRKGKEAPRVGGQVGKKMKRCARLLLYFHSPGCHACRTMTPVIDKMRKANDCVLSINIANDMETARAFGVMGTPATVVVEGGRIAEFMVGPQRPERLQALLQA